jgi:hypothetical protein
MEVITDAGIGWHVSRTWPGGRQLERVLKDRHAGPRLCPDCTPHPAPVTRGRAAQARPPATTRPADQPAGQAAPIPAESARPGPYQRGAERGRRFLAEHQQLGRTADQVESTYRYITGPWHQQPRHAGRADAEMRGYTQAITAGLAQMRGQRRPQPEAEAGQ